jgi:hypothetical protein
MSLARKKVTAPICLETPAFGRGRVAFGDRQMVAVTFFLSVLTALLTAAAGRTAHGIEAGMPNPPASPTRVQCAIIILEVTDVDDVNESFEAEIALIAGWNDPRLAFDPETEGTTSKLFQGEFQFNEVYKGWWPQLIILNQIGRGETKGLRLEVLPNGDVRYREQRSARLETPMALQAYPFDTQRLRASVVPFGNTIDQVVLEVDERFTDTTDDRVRRGSDVNVAGWSLRHLDMAMDETVILVGHGESRFSRLVATIHLQRRSWQLVWQMLFPLIVIVSMVWSIFWVDPEQLADRLNVAFIGVLTIVAYQFVVLDDMPRMSYLTFTDTLLLVSFLTMSATIPQSLVMNRLARRGHEQQARRIDRICRWAFPLAYLAMVATTVAWFRLT